MNTKYSKLIARILTTFIFILFIVPTIMGLSITSIEVLTTEDSSNTTAKITTSKDDKDELMEKWYEVSHVTIVTTTEAVKTEKKAVSTKNHKNDTKTIELVESQEMPVTTEVTEVAEEPIIESTIVEIPQEDPVFVPEPEIVYEEHYIETEAPVIENIPESLPVQEAAAEPENPPAYTNDSWYYPTLLTHDGYNTSWSYDNQMILKKYCDMYSVDYELMLAIISKESGYNQYACSYAGAIGLCQVMPITITQFNMDTGVYYGDYYSIEANIHVGVYTMSACIKKYGNMYDACCAYANGLYYSGVGGYSGYAESATALRERILGLKRA